MAGPPADRPGLSIVKLGGSILTWKRRREALRPKVLARLGRELASGTGPIVVLHGAGSFGHPSARRFGLASAPASGEPGTERARGASIVAREVRRLHSAVVQNLVAAGLCPWSIPGANVARNRAGELARFDASAFQDALSASVAPVSFGDVVRDDFWGFSILSADTSAKELARQLVPARVIFVSDVPGVLDPGVKGRPVAVPVVSRDLVDRLKPAENVPDVTGGIRAKAEAMLAIADGGPDVGLISGLSDGLLSRALRGERVYGSWVEGARR